MWSGEEVAPAGESCELVFYERSPGEKVEIGPWRLTSVHVREEIGGDLARVPPVVDGDGKAGQHAAVAGHGFQTVGFVPASSQFSGSSTAQNARAHEAQLEVLCQDQVTD